MTGIERLRALAYKKNYLEPAEARELDAIADQIERERECDADTIENLRLELGEARDHAADVSMSAYDLLPQEEREAISWVREHGGLERVKAQRFESMPRAAYDRKKAGFLDHIAECERALGRRNERISELEERVRVRERANDELNEELNAMRPRLMPEGYEWPRYETGEPVRIGDFVSDVEVRSVVFRDDGILLSDCTSVPGWGTWRSYKEPIRRPAPKVLDADGVEIRVGDTVWDVEFGCEHVVTKVSDGAVFVAFEDESADRCDPASLTHRAPVLAVDGKPLREGETVWDTNGDELVIGALENGGHTVICRYVDVGDAIPVHGMWSPSDLTHERPVADTWERLGDLVRRARALAGVSE